MQVLIFCDYGTKTVTYAHKMRFWDLTPKMGQFNQSQKVHLLV